MVFIYIDYEEVKNTNSFSKLPCSIGTELTIEEEKKIYMSRGTVRKVVGDWSYHIRGSVVVCTSVDLEKQKRYISDIFLDMSSYEYSIYGIQCGRESKYLDAKRILADAGFINYINNDMMKVWEKGIVRISIWLEYEQGYICRIALQLKHKCLKRGVIW